MLTRYVHEKLWMQDFATMMEKAAHGKNNRNMLGDFNCDLLKSDSSTKMLLAIGLEYGLKQVTNCDPRMTGY